MNVEEFIARGTSVAGAGFTTPYGPIHYQLSKGNSNPTAPHPGQLVKISSKAVRMYSDCSGFLTWMMRKERQIKDAFYLRALNGWVNTDSMSADANHPSGFLDKIDIPRRGCFMMYPKNSEHIHGGLRSIGHCGVVLEVREGRPSLILHCSSGNDRKLGHAIAVTGPEHFWTNKTVYCWWKELAA